MLATEAAIRTVRCNYLYVIEWLAEGETKTGTRLAELVQAAHGIQVRLAKCGSAREVVAQIEWAEAHVPQFGVPIIHFEAHGVEPENAGTTSPGLQGPDGSGGFEMLSWDQAAPALRRLNLATDFRLMVVGAACYSLATLNTIETGEMAPFELLVGFNSTVHPTRLLAACRELYRTLFSQGGSLPAAVRNASNELHVETEGEWLHATDVYKFALDLVRQTVFHELEPGHRARKNVYLSNAIYDARGEIVSPDEVGRQFPDYIVRTVERYAAVWFAYDRVPSNRQRFPIDVRATIREAIAHYGALGRSVTP